MQELLRLLRRALFPFLAVILMNVLPATAETELTLWSHWADHDSKRTFVEDAARAFEQANPGVKITITWYEKQALHASLKTALRAGQAPDIFYAEPNQTEYVENKLLYDLSGAIDWSKVEGWAKDSWSYQGGVYGLPLEAWTIELYYNKQALADLGFKLPESKQFSQAEFLALVKASAEKGLTPIALGVGDRPFPGAFLTHEALIQTLGLEDYNKLLRGELDWGDVRVRQALEFVKSLVEAKALPNSFSTLKLGESHFYFHTKPGALTFLMGSFYPSRAFNPPDKGGQPEGFQLGIMMYPALDGAACQNCKSITIGGSYVVNAASKSRELAAQFLNSLATPEMANKWLDMALVQTGIKADPSKITGPNAGYFQELAEIDGMCQFYDALPMGIMQGETREVFTQVVNQAFPAGLVSVDEVIEKMNAVRK
jgi:multiple sugar transport system substrate-binding protein